MAIYDNLPVFKASYDLVIEIFKMCGGMPRDYKYTIGEKLKNTLIELMVGIYKANTDTDRAEMIRQCRQQVVEAKLYLRLLHDLKQLSTKRFATLAEDIEVISKQLKAWHKSTENKNRDISGVS